MIAIIFDGTMAIGPMEWSALVAGDHLYQLGYTRRDGVLHGPAGQTVTLPSAEPTSALDLPGFRVLPVIQADASPPEGKALSGHAPVILADCVEMRPVWVDLPPSPGGAVQALTKLEFLALFTDEEKVRLKSLESTDPTVALFWEEYRTADSILLDDQRVIRGLEYLAAAGHLTAERKAAILAGGS